MWRRVLTHTYTYGADSFVGGAVDSLLISYGPTGGLSSNCREGMEGRVGGGRGEGDSVESSGWGFFGSARHVVTVIVGKFT